MPADGREEDAAGPHAQDGRDVLDERDDPVLATRPREAPQEGLDGRLVDPAGRAQLRGGLRDEEVDGEDRRADRRREPRAALDAVACLVVEPVDADERPAGPGHGRLGGQRDLVAGRVDGAAHDVGGALGGRVVAHVAGHQAQLETGPRAAGEPLGDLVSLGSGLEQRDGGGASRHMS